MESEQSQEKNAVSLAGLGCPGQPFSMRLPWLDTVVLSGRLFLFRLVLDFFIIITDVLNQQLASSDDRK